MLVSFPVRLASSLSDFCSTKMTDLDSIQCLASLTRRDAMELVNGLWHNTAGVVWVSDEDADLQLAL